MPGSTTRPARGGAAGNPALSRLLWLLGGTGLLVSIWWILSLVFHEMIIASPLSAFASLGGMMATAGFWSQVGVTLQWFGLALLLGGLAGFGLGLAAGLNTRAKWLLEPLRWSLMTMPPVVVVVVSMIWFGMGSAQTVFVTGLLVLPIIYVNTVAGMEAVDSLILEMGRVYHAGLALRLSEIYLPGLGGQLLSGLTLAAGFGVRIVVLAELLGAYSGIGYSFAMTRTNLDTPALFAWIVVCLVLGGGLDLALLGPLKKHLLRWKPVHDIPG